VLPAYFSYALKEIRRRKLRSSANVIGYVVAVAFMIILVSLAQAYSLMSTNILRGIGTHFGGFIPATMQSSSEVSAEPFFKGVYTETFNMSVVEAIRASPGVEDAAPCLMCKLGSRTIGGIDINRLATKTTAVALDEVVEGRYLEATDHDGVMLDKVFADSRNLHVGDNIDAFNHTFEVIGIVYPSLNSKPAGIAEMYAQIRVVQDIMQSEDINVVLVEVAPKGDTEEVIRVQRSVLETLEAYVGKSGSIAGYSCYAPARNVVPMTEESAWMISLVLVASVTLFSLKSQFGVVVERTKEIGILKSIGWTDSDVMKQIVVESVLQGFAGGVVGVCLGYIIAFLIPALGILSSEDLIMTVSPLLIIGGLTAALIGGIVAGIFPAWRAAKLQPAEALRRF